MSALGDIERLLGDAEGPQLLSLEAKRLRQALADAEHRGAERERSRVLRALAVIPYKDVFQYIKTGKHLGGGDE